MDKKSFTLLEVLFVVIVIAILAAIVIPRLVLTQKMAKEKACDANVANINKQVELYYFNTGSWPDPELLNMKPPTTYQYFPDGVPDCPVTPQQYNLDDPLQPEDGIIYNHRVRDSVDSDGDHDHFASEY